MQIVNQPILFSELLTELEMVDCFGLRVGEHLFEVVLILRKYPLEVRGAFSPPSFFPYLPTRQQLFHHFLIVIALADQKTVLIALNYSEGLLLAG